MKTFNNVLDDFFEYLETNFPDFSSDLILSRMGVQMVRAANPRLVIEQFMTMIAPLKQKILDCDEDFFLNFQMSANETSNENLLLCSKVKKIWMSDGISREQKAKIFLEFHKLIKSGTKVQEFLS